MAHLLWDMGEQERRQIVIEDLLVEIETKLAHLADTVQELNALICAQQKQVEQLETMCKLLVERIRNYSEPSDVGKLIDGKPPHHEA